MIHGYATLLLTFGALATAVLYLWGEYSPAAKSTRPHFYPLILGIILLIALIVPVPVSIFYKAAILLGLLLTIVGSAFSLLPGTPPVVNKAHGLLVLLLYMVAFAALHPGKWPTPWLLLLLLYAGGIAWLLAPRVAELQISFLVYGLVLLLMTWQALEVLVVAGQVWAALPLIGAICFVIADSLQALDRFYRTLPSANLLTPALFLLGHLLLALSIWEQPLTTVLSF